MYFMNLSVIKINTEYRLHGPELQQRWKVVFFLTHVEDILLDFLMDFQTKAPPDSGQRTRGTPRGTNPSISIIPRDMRAVPVYITL